MTCMLGRLLTFDGSCQYGTTISDLALDRERKTLDEDVCVLHEKKILVVDHVAIA